MVYGTDPPGQSWLSETALFRVPACLFLCRGRKFCFARSRTSKVDSYYSAIFFAQYRLSRSRWDTDNVPLEETGPVIARGLCSLKNWIPVGIVVDHRAPIYARRKTVNEVIQRISMIQSKNVWHVLTYLMVVRSSTQSVLKAMRPNNRI